MERDGAIIKIVNYRRLMNQVEMIR